MRLMPFLVNLLLSRMRIAARHNHFPASPIPAA
jgi:hypothetical protein